MCNRDSEICVCNDLTAGEISDFIKQNNISTLEQLCDNDILPMGDKCQSCREDGYEDDGLSLALVLKMTNNNQL